MACSLHSGIRCPVEDDPPDKRGPETPGAIGYSVTRLHEFLSIWRFKKKWDGEAVRCNVWMYLLWRMQPLERDTDEKKKIFKKKKKKKKKDRSVSTSFRSKSGDGRIVLGWRERR